MTLSLLLGILTTVGVFVLFVVNLYPDDFGEYAAMGACSLLLGSLVMVISWAICTVGIRLPDSDITFTSKAEQIYALSDGQSAESSFFLGSGHVGGTVKYFYIADGEYGKTIKNVDAEKAYIIEEDGEPYLEVKTGVEYKKLKDRFIHGEPHTVIYVFHIPKGSIKYNFNVDLE